MLQKKQDQYFKNNEGTPAILVFQKDGNNITISDLNPLFEKIDQVEGIKEYVPLTTMPPQATANFFSKDQSTVILPLTLEPSLESKEMRTVLEEITEIVEKNTDLTLNITGPAGIAVDSLICSPVLILFCYCRQLELFLFY